MTSSAFFLNTNSNTSILEQRSLFKLSLRKKRVETSTNNLRSNLKLLQEEKLDVDLSYKLEFKPVEKSKFEIFESDQSPLRIQSFIDNCYSQIMNIELETLFALIHFYFENGFTYFIKQIDLLPCLMKRIKLDAILIFQFITLLSKINKNCLLLLSLENVDNILQALLEVTPISQLKINQLEFYSQLSASLNKLLEMLFKEGDSHIKGTVLKCRLLSLVICEGLDQSKIEFGVLRPSSYPFSSLLKLIFTISIETTIDQDSDKLKLSSITIFMKDNLLEFIQIVGNLFQKENLLDENESLIPLYGTGIVACCLEFLRLNQPKSFETTSKLNLEHYQMLSCQASEILLKSDMLIFIYKHEIKSQLDLLLVLSLIRYYSDSIPSALYIDSQGKKISNTESQELYVTDQIIFNFFSSEDFHQIVFDIILNLLSNPISESGLQIVKSGLISVITHTLNLCQDNTILDNCFNLVEILLNVNDNRSAIAVIQNKNLLGGLAKFLQKENRHQNKVNAIKSAKVLLTILSFYRKNKDVLSNLELCSTEGCKVYLNQLFEANTVSSGLSEIISKMDIDEIEEASELKEALMSISN